MMRQSERLAVLNNMRKNMKSGNYPKGWRHAQLDAVGILHIMGKFKNLGSQIGAFIRAGRRADDEGEEFEFLNELFEDIELLPKRAIHPIWMNICHDDFTQDHFLCAHCKSEIYHDDDAQYSEDSEQKFGPCCEHEFEYSELMQDYIHRDNTTPYYSTRRALDHQNPTGYATYDFLYNSSDYFYNEAVEAWVINELHVEIEDEHDRESDEHDEDYDEEDDEDSSSIIGQYHSSSRKLKNFLISDKYQHEKHIPLGMELEVEVIDSNRRSMAELVKGLIGYAKDGNEELIQAPYCFLEGDGSLDYGFEIVTAPCSLDIHEKQMRLLTGNKDVRKSLRSHDTRTCGLHVHINKEDTTAWHRGKIVAFINDPANESMIKAIARRYQGVNGDGGYAKFNGAKGLKSHYSRDRYEAINLTNERTIEFRIFRGSLRFETIMSCLEFTRITWLFCADAGAHNLNQAEFLRYICLPENSSSTKHLRGILQERNILTGRPALREFSICAAPERVTS